MLWFFYDYRSFSFKYLQRGALTEQKAWSSRTQRSQVFSFEFLLHELNHPSPTLEGKLIYRMVTTRSMLHAFVEIDEVFAFGNTARDYMMELGWGSKFGNSRASDLTSYASTNAPRWIHSCFVIIFTTAFFSALFSWQDRVRTTNSILSLWRKQLYSQRILVPLQLWNNRYV